MTSTLPATQLAVVQTEAYKIEVLERPTPKLLEDTDVIVKVAVSALCGSDLHIYRGALAIPLGFITSLQGHEFAGEVAAAGPAVKYFKVGQKVVSPFNSACGTCYFCVRGWSGRCENGLTFGTPGLQGSQCEYVRVPRADTTLFDSPPDIPQHLLVLMSDIVPTGLFATKSAWNILNDVERKEAVAVVLGCGPVGLCAVTAASKQFKTVYAIDSVPERLELARKHGAIPLNLNENPKDVLSKLAGGGPDAVLEIVGSPDAMLLALDLVRIGGVIVSAGFHTKNIDFPAAKCYAKNVRLQFGRCPAGSMFKEALELLREVSKVGLFDNFVEAQVPLSEAAKYYKMFNERQIGKVVFVSPN